MSQQKTSGFTLLEILFSILILGIGLVAVAGLFPVGGSLQRLALDEILSQQAAESGKAYMLARGVPRQSLETMRERALDGFTIIHGQSTNQDFQIDDPDDLFPIRILNDNETMQQRYDPPLKAAAYAASRPYKVYSIPDPETGVWIPWIRETDFGWPQVKPVKRVRAGRANMPGRDYYWLPMFRKTDFGWMCYLLVFRPWMGSTRQVIPNLFWADADVDTNFGANRFRALTTGSGADSRGWIAHLGGYPYALDNLGHVHRVNARSGGGRDAAQELTNGWIETYGRIPAHARPGTTDPFGQPAPSINRFYWFQNEARDRPSLTQVVVIGDEFVK